MTTRTRAEVAAAFRAAGIDPDLHGSLADPNVVMAAVARDVLDRAFGPDTQDELPSPDGMDTTMTAPAPVPPTPFTEAQRVNVTLTVSAAVLIDDGGDIYVELEDGRRMDVPRSAVTPAGDQR